ncbi:MAG: hypothetical protein IJ840_04640 [Bacteroidales bacterium]|nr:hypothetical protein [Bacteroidales bacterium]
MILQTNVKLNFGLNVIRKRPDGYHDIETLFVPCHEFGDTLEVITGDDYSRTSAGLVARYRSFADAQDDRGNAIRQGISEDGRLMITIAREEGVDWEPLEDLCAKAYFLLAEDFKLPTVKMFLEKKAPVGAGLGGGSADAAFTLKALNELCGLGLSDERLSEYASRLGSDCAFFIWNRPMIGTGRGEILEPFDLDLEGYEVKVLVPEGIAVSTAEAYRGIVPRMSIDGGTTAPTTVSLRSTPPLASHSEAPVPPLSVPRVAAVAGAVVPPSERGAETLISILQRPVEDWKGLLANDFETTVFKAHPELEAIKNSLYESGAVYASMSGSGSALFAIYKR